MAFRWVSSEDQSKEDQSVDRAGQKYFKKLLQNINIMLNHVNENGIIVPDDLTKKITALFTGAEVPAATIATAASIAPASPAVDKDQ